MIITGFVNKDNIPYLRNENGVETYQFPKVYTNREQLEDMIGKDNVVEVQIEILPRKVHV